MDSTHPAHPAAAPLMVVVVLVLTAEVDGVGRHATQLVDNRQVDDEHRHRNDCKRRQVNHLSNVALDQQQLSARD